MMASTYSSSSLAGLVSRSTSDNETGIAAGAQAAGSVSMTIRPAWHGWQQLREHVESVEVVEYLSNNETRRQ